MIRVSCILLALVALVGLPSGAQIIPLGDDFQVNQLTTGDQRLPTVGVAADGSFVVAWQSDVSGGDDSYGRSIQARRFSAEGNPLGDDFQVNTYTPESQYAASLRMEPGGDFVVAWRWFYDIPFAPPIFEVSGQVFDAQGTGVGEELVISVSSGYNYHSGGRIVGDGPGGFVSTLGSYSVSVSRFSGDGTPLGTVTASETAPGTGSQPRASVDSGGNFAVVWASEVSPDGDDSSGRSIQARPFDSMGQPLSGQFQINQITTGEQSYPEVALLDNGRYLVIWNDQGVGDGSGSRIQGRLGELGGGPLGEEFQINTATSADQQRGHLDRFGSSAFVVVWQSDSSSATGSAVDSDGTSIVGRIVGDDGTLRGPELQINTHTTSSQTRPLVDSGGNTFVVVWQSPSSPGDDSDGLSIVGRRFVHGRVFSDGFESGDLSRWSDSQPPAKQ